MIFYIILKQYNHKIIPSIVDWLKNYLWGERSKCWRWQPEQWVSAGWILVFQLAVKLDFGLDFCVFCETMGATIQWKITILKIWHYDLHTWDHEVYFFIILETTTQLRQAKLASKFGKINFSWIFPIIVRVGHT